MQPEERLRALEALSRMGSAGRAESEPVQSFPLTYYPVGEHIFVFDPDVSLIVGDRGSGKSELFRAVVQENLLPAIWRALNPHRAISLDPAQEDWLAGYPLGTQFADASGLRRFMQDQQAQPGIIADLWFAYLTRVCTSKMSAGLLARLEQLHLLPGGDVDGIYTQFKALRSLPLLALDQLDEELKIANRWLFVSYDELDTLGAYDWAVMDWAIRGLIDFWVRYSRRWQRIRAKIFIRTDLYHRHSQNYGPDLIKLTANRVQLTWNRRSLYAMLIKRAANSSDQLAVYCQNAGIRFSQDAQLGLIPQLSNEEQARPWIEQMICLYMGDNITKGQTFTWLIDRIQDGKGQAAPRPLVRLIELAAAQELAAPKASADHLLHPTALRQALDEVSKEHVLQVNTHELPWLSGAVQRLKGASTPIERREVERLLEKNWRGSWTPGQAVDVKPPFTNKKDMVDYLLEIGVFRQRGKDQLDAPDLFLSGLGLKRKGGVQRRSSRV